MNFNYSKEDYEALTPKEKALIYKAWENKIVSDTQFIYNACFTAFYNANRPKRKRPLKLFKKLAVRSADKEVIEENISIAKEAEKNDGNWIQKILKGRRIARKER